MILRQTDIIIYRIKHELVRGGQWAFSKRKIRLNYINREYKMTGNSADFVSVISSDLRGSTTSTQAFPISKVS